MEHHESKTELISRDAYAAPATSRTGLLLRLFLRLLGGLRIGTLDVRLPDGELRTFRGSERPELHGVLLIRDGALMRHIMRNGEVGLGEAYLEGLWDSPDLTALLGLLYLNEPYIAGPFEKNPLMRFAGWIRHRLRANTKAQARKNISFHYDLGNEFYRAWLDPSMAYSSGIYANSTYDLARAQREKFEQMYQRLDLRPEHTLLEIGSGWGGFALYAAQNSGCRVHSITLSAEQMAEARLRAEQAGVADRVTFELRDYRDVNQQYDRVVSIEMYEAVGEEYWPGYFQTIARALKPGGIAAIQGITIHPEIFDAYRRKIDFIQKYIFPGGMLATPGIFMDQAMRAGLAPVDPRFFGLDYARTLADWHRNVLATRAQIVRQFDERFLRLWRYYLAYCECGFRVGRVDLMQVTLHKT